MRSKMGSAPVGSGARFLLVIAAAAALSGCGSHQTSTQGLEQQFKDNPEFKRQSVAHFAGTVTVDGQPPEEGTKLFVILTDFQHLDANAHVDAPKLHRTCDSKGAFAFGTYEVADGAPVGKYVVTFVELKDPNPGVAPGTSPRDFRSRRSVGGTKAFRPPDVLKNLYNDPDKNSKDPQFVIELSQPGKDDYKFDLVVAGKEGVAAAPNAVTSIRMPH
jgi:hypothetical protein